MLTVDSLVLLTDLNIHYVAGATGGGRPVTWAHAVDLPDPWEWVGAGDLVMTTGAGMPVDESAQAEWLRRLIESGASGLVVASPPGAVDISQAMRQEAEVSSFPLLSAPFELEFVSLARLIIKNSLAIERQQLDKAKRLFDAYGESISRDFGVEQRLRAIARSVGWELELVDDVDGETMFASPFKVASLTESSVMAIPGRFRMSLRIQKPFNAAQDALLTYYVAAIMALELEQQAKQLDDLREQGSVVLKELLEGIVEISALAPLLKKRSLGEQMVLICVQPDSTGPYTSSDIHLARALRETKVLLTEAGGKLIALVPDESEVPEAMTRLLGNGTKTGVSSRLSAAVGAQEALRQAHLALQDACESAVATCRYGEDNTESGLFPRNVAESRAIVDRVLGRLVEHDRASRSDLMKTLETFLGADRSIVRASQILSIHRQTLVYRLNTIQQITGLHPSSTEGTTQFWFALQTGRRAGLLP